MKEIHILVTGVGRRVELMQAFRQAALNLNINLQTPIVITNTNSFKHIELCQNKLVSTGDVILKITK